jgi:hypothetical protein
MNRFDVDEKVIWTSPHTGNQTVVSYRGVYEGEAIIWTGRLQITVPHDQLAPMPEEPAQ